MLKQALRKMIKGQKGQALPIVLILLAIGGLLIVPTLNYASTSLKGHEVVERKGEELYAADSGVEYALLKLSNGETTLNDYQLNGKTVSVNITDMGDGSYLITSTATSDGGSSTTIRAGVSGTAGFSFLFDNAITSPGDVTIKPGSQVTGNVTYGEDIDNKGTINGDETNDPDLADSWPTADDISPFYLDQVDGLTPYPDSIIDLKDTDSIGPLYRQGSLSVRNTGSVTTAVLNGTVYVTGDLTFEQPGVPSAYTINLNSQSIYVEGSIWFPAHGCTLSGSGCIIAEGDINFQPGISSSPDDFIFVMSIEGSTTVSPQGDLYGSIAGNTEIYLSPGCTLTWHDPGEEGTLNFPEGSGVLGSSTGDMTLGGWDVS